MSATDKVLAAGLCECGCGERTNLAPKNNAAKGWVKGKPTRYVNGHQQRKKRRRGVGRSRTAARSWQDHGRSIDGSPETLQECLLAFGVSEDALARALRERTVESLHWGAWWASGELRKHCRCEVPREVAEELGRAS